MSGNQLKRQHTEISKLDADFPHHSWKHGQKWLEEKGFEQCYWQGLPSARQALDENVYQFAIKSSGILLGSLLLVYGFLTGFLLPAFNFYENRFTTMLYIQETSYLLFQRLSLGLFWLLALHNESLNQKNQKDCCESQHVLLSLLLWHGKQCLAGSWVPRWKP